MNLHRLVLARPARLALCAAVLLCARLASAQSALSLRWSAPADCPSLEDVRRMALNGTALEGTAADSDALEADAEVQRALAGGAQRYRVVLRTRRGSERGERRIEAATCSGVARATALVLSLALAAPPERTEAAPGDSEPGSTSAEGTPPQSAGRSPAGTLAPLRPSAPQPARGVIASQPAPTRNAGEPPAPAVSEKPVASAGARAHAVALGVSFSGDLSTLPAAAAGGGLSLAWLAGRARLELEARRWLPQSRTVDTFAAGARFSMTSLAARGCWAASANDVFELGPCGGVDVHMVSAPGFGVAPDYGATAEWTALAGGAQGRLLLASWFALRARVEAAIPLSRPIFVLEGGGRLHRPGALGGAAGMGAELLFF